MPRDTDLPGEALIQRDPPTPPSARGLLALPLLLVGIRLARPSPSLVLGPRSVVFLLRPALRESTCLSWRRRWIGYALAAALHGLRPQGCSGRRARPRAGVYATLAQLAARAAILCEPAFANRETRIEGGGGTWVGRCCNRVYQEATFLNVPVGRRRRSASTLSSFVSGQVLHRWTCPSCTGSAGRRERRAACR